MSAPILDKILADIKETMKSKDTEKLITLRTLHSEIKNVGINKRKEITDEDVLAVISKGIKQRVESIEQFKKGSRNDLVEKEEAQIALYKLYQPQQMERPQIEELVDKVLAETGVTSPKEIGAVMKALMPLVKGKADGAVVNQVVRDALSKITPQQ
ncbi:MAG: GatB/YqeY domain-containing protein [Dehalococcoidia bacterium]|nr:MAG: GatB/YqeY domain-containing protein [Dehalococcoidia bacterium]